MQLKFDQMRSMATTLNSLLQDLCTNLPVIIVTIFGITSIFSTRNIFSISCIFSISSILVSAAISASAEILVQAAFSALAARLFVYLVVISPYYNNSCFIFNPYLITKNHKKRILTIREDYLYQIH